MRRGLLAIALVASAGCGFTGEAPFTERRLPDVAPWLDLGPVTFCDGAVRIGAPASHPAGFCLDGPPALRACQSDADCRSRERCTCAGCQVALCDLDADCPAGDVCSVSDHRCDRPCQRDGDCAGGEACARGLGVCRAGCSSGSDCQAGEVCDQGGCVASLGGSGEPCAKDGDCIDHPACVVQRVPGELREPSPLLDGDGAIVLYVERRGETGSAIWRATAPAAFEVAPRFRFDPPAPVIAPDDADAGRAGAPSVIALGGRFLAAYANGAGHLRIAESDDGIAFTVERAPLLVPAGTWDASGLDAPALAPSPTPSSANGGGLVLYYAAADRSALGFAESQDGKRFAARPDPVLTPSRIADPARFRGVDAVAAPFAQTVVQPDGSRAMRLYFAARGRESGDAVKFGMSVPEAPNFSVDEAGTLDGPTLVPLPDGPVFDRTLQFLDHLSEEDPAVLLLDEARQLLFYRGASADESRKENLGVARNPPP